jgi:amidase
MTDREIWARDAVEIADLIRRREVTSLEVVAAAIDRFEAVNAATNALVIPLFDAACATAAAADAALRSGVPVGPLHGVPVTIKINADQEGLANDNGVAAFRTLIAPHDNPVVANLRRAGAIVIGRTNAPAFSMRWFTDNDLYGRTRSPWRAAATPGGSSGGAAVAVATGIGYIAHGNDIAGSIRYPAFCCGVLGLRPTYGRVPAYNASSPSPPPFANQLMAVQGPLARRVADLRLGFQAMAGRDVGDPRSLDIGALPDVQRPLRIAIAPNPGGRPSHPAVAEAVRSVGAWLEAAGCHVEEVDPPAFVQTADLWPAIAMPDVIAALEPQIAQYGDAGIRKAVGLWRDCWPGRDPATCLRALSDRMRLQRAWGQFLETYPVLITPCSCEPPFGWDADVQDAATTARIIAAQAPLLATSALGLPALAIPTGLHEGLPLGVQLVADRYREDLCFEVAGLIERCFAMPTPVDPVT